MMRDKIRTTVEIR